jgi:hypothetical protein
VWINFNPDRPAGPDVYWDNAIIKWLLSEAWVPGMPTFTHHTTFDQVPDDEGCVVVTPGHYGAEGIAQLNEAIGGLPWVVVAITSDEEGVFPAWLIEHPNMRVWKQHPARRHAWQPDVALPLGWRPGTREHFAGTEPPVKELDWAFMGQGGMHRGIALNAIVTLPNGHMKVTKGFAQGIDQAEYLDTLASARVAPCPPGPHVPDTFRQYEAYEAGCVPVITDDWVTAVNQAVTDFDVLAPMVGAAWMREKRRLTYQLRDDLELLSGGERYWSNTEQITVLVSTSPIASHPDTAILDETIQSIRDRLPLSEILVMCDGVRPEQTELTDDYLEYLRRVVWKAMHHWDNTYPIIMPTFVHQAEATRRTLQQVHTPYVLFVEHDTPLIGDIPFAQLVDAVAAEDLIVRLHHEAAVHPEHEFLNVGKVRRVAGVSVQPTVQWSQRPHLATTDKYRHLIATYFTPDSRTFIEDKMHGIAHYDPWEAWRLAVYHPDGDIKRSTHSDGRAGASKFDVVF